MVCMNKPTFPHMLWVHRDPWCFTKEQTFPIYHGCVGTHDVYEQINLSHMLWVHRDPWCFDDIQTMMGVFIYMYKNLTVLSGDVGFFF